ncbi:MAG: hypothetical protein ABL907_26295 [Hyphomicrobium sp.]
METENDTPLLNDDERQDEADEPDETGRQLRLHFLPHVPEPSTSGEKFVSSETQSRNDERKP